MNNNLWIQPGVKAKIITCVGYPQFIGRIVTVKSRPEPTHCDIIDETHLAVPIEESADFLPTYHFSPGPEQLEPWPKDKLPDWEALAEGTTFNNIDKIKELMRG